MRKTWRRQLALGLAVVTIWTSGNAEHFYAGQKDCETPAIRNLIREGKSFQIQSMIQTSKKLGMQAMDDAIYDLYMQNKISAEDAVSFATDSIV